MVGDLPGDYLDGLTAAQRAELEHVNRPGLTALQEYLAAGDAVAFLGAGVSAPLYPLWAGLIGELIDAAAPRMSEREAETCRELAGESPEDVVEIVRPAWVRGSTGRCCGRPCRCVPTRRPAGRGRRCRNWCAGARSKPW